MNLFFKEPQTVLRMREGPLGQYIDSYAAEIRAEGYAHGSAVLQIRLVAAFSRWMVKHRIKAQEITAAQVERYVRSRARDRCPGRSDHAALKRLLNLLLRQGVTPEPSLPASTPLIQTARRVSCLFAAGTSARIDHGERLPIIHRRVSGRVFRYRPSGPVLSLRRWRDGIRPASRSVYS